MYYQLGMPKWNAVVQNDAVSQLKLLTWGSFVRKTVQQERHSHIQPQKCECLACNNTISPVNVNPQQTIEIEVLYTIKLEVNINVKYGKSF